MNELVLNDNLVIRPSQAKEIANKIVASVLNPESDKLIAWSNLTQLEKAIELAKKAIKEDDANVSSTDSLKIAVNIDKVSLSIKS
jgi:hypothetical protein